MGKLEKMRGALSLLSQKFCSNSNEFVHFTQTYLQVCAVLRDLQYKTILQTNVADIGDMLALILRVMSCDKAIR